MSVVEAREGAEVDNSISAVILHRNEVIKRGLEKLLTENSGVVRVCSYNSWSRVLSLLATRTDDHTVLVVPRSLVGDGTELRAVCGPSIKVLLLLDGPEPYDSVPETDAWVDGFLVESTITAQSLAVALNHLRRGQMPMPSTMARSLLSEVTKLRELSAAQRLRLTQREVQTLQLIADGLSNKQIARQLCIGVNGVKRLVSDLLAKLNCPNRTRAAAYAVRIGLVGDNRITEHAEAMRG
ncbi:response regulator transcription factor [Saccharopolyspora hattusasensis]|uniref:response regulator transcription factor n=1 Tax=Saccharopolyspora hattusasensis TaxID=1128679 RepID=UPI003D97E4B4